MNDKRVGSDDFLVSTEATAEDVDGLPRIALWPELAPEALHGPAGRIVQALDAYTEGRLGACPLRLQDVDRVIAIGSDRMMAAVARARHDLLKDHLKPRHAAIGSINSPMQCMMKEICAQCLQPHRDPETGETSYVFSCFNQDQPLDRVDFKVLNDRLRQNSLAEKLTAKWIRYCMPELKKQRAFV